MQSQIKPKNSWALSIWYLIRYKTKGFSMKDACGEHFYKIQTRLLEIERGRSLELKVLRTPMKSKNRFGHPMNYTLYKSLADEKYLIDLLQEFNEKGSKALNT